MKVKLLKFSNSTIVKKFIQHINIYKTGKKVYNYYVNTSNLLRNEYIYAKNYI